MPCKAEGSIRQTLRHPERSRLKGGVVEGPGLGDATTEQVPPLRAAHSGRDDGSWNQRREICADGVPNLTFVFRIVLVFLLSRCNF